MRKSPSKLSTITIDGLSVELIRSKRRSLGLELSPLGIKARAPLKMPEQDIVSFVRLKRRWIDKHLGNMPEPQVTTPLTLQHGALLKLRGQDYRLSLRLGSRDPIRIFGDQIEVPIIKVALDNPQDQARRIRNKLTKWYKEVAHQELRLRAQYYAAQMEVPRRRADQIAVKDYKRRWGCCDSSGKLSFNWRIIQAPTRVSDYVVVHELAHCHEFNHSKRFWAIVAKQMPEYAAQEAWLNQHGHQLYLF